MVWNPVESGKFLFVEQRYIRIINKAAEVGGNKATRVTIMALGLHLSELSQMKKITCLFAKLALIADMWLAGWHNY